jgi:hemerythrin-like domain-containing protein
MIDRPLAPGFDEPLEMLSACHERIEAQLATLERMVPHLETRGCDAEARSAAQAVLRYFDTSGVLHHQDEDEDLFPLLRARAAEHERPEVAATLDELEREHATMHAQWTRLRERLQAIAGGEARLDPEEVARFAWLYRRHMDRESAAVLPFAREALDEAQRAALGKRMAARRNIP